MVKKTKAATKRTKVKDLAKSKLELTAKNLKKIKGGTASTMLKVDKSNPDPF